ncbi:MAG: hypothetical protein IJW83_03710 [Clostridia bacterium]|nr:hypothetical protein [Clostridia bacterium]
MTYVVCVDDRMGMLFGGRRLSRDREQLKRMRRTLGNRSLYILPYSAKLFEETSVCITDDPAMRKEGCALFLEEYDPAPYLRKGDHLLVYHWGRHYPSDLRMSVDLSRMRRLSSCTFVGSSHSEMLEEEYEIC